MLLTALTHSGNGMALGRIGWDGMGRPRFVYCAFWSVQCICVYLFFLLFTSLHFCVFQ